MDMVRLKYVCLPAWNCLILLMLPFGLSTLKKAASHFSHLKLSSAVIEFVASIKKEGSLKISFKSYILLLQSWAKYL